MSPKQVLTKLVLTCKEVSSVSSQAKRTTMKLKQKTKKTMAGVKSEIHVKMHIIDCCINFSTDPKEQGWNNWKQT